MSFILRSVGNKISLSDIENFEMQYNIIIPNEYKEFLLKNNGGSPENFLFTTEFDEVQPGNSEVKKQATDIERFFSLRELFFEYEDIIDDDYIESKYIPIARTSFGNLILLSAENHSDSGKVYFSNHDIINPNNGKFLISEIKSTFVEFIDSLYVEKIN